MLDWAAAVQLAALAQPSQICSCCFDLGYEKDATHLRVGGPVGSGYACDSAIDGGSSALTVWICHVWMTNNSHLSTYFVQTQPCPLFLRCWLMELPMHHRPPCRLQQSYSPVLQSVESFAGDRNWSYSQSHL